MVDSDSYKQELQNLLKILLTFEADFVDLQKSFGKLEERFRELHENLEKEIENG